MSLKTIELFPEGVNTVISSASEGLIKLQYAKDLLWRLISANHYAEAVVLASLIGRLGLQIEVCVQEEAIRFNTRPSTDNAIHADIPDNVAQAAKAGMGELLAKRDARLREEAIVDAAFTKVAP